MELGTLIRKLRRSLMIFNDASYEEALNMIERNNKNLPFKRYLLYNDMDFGLIESFASRCYYAKLFMENMKFEDIDFLENICNDNKSNDMFLELLRLYNALSDMTAYFDTLDTPLAARDLYYSYTDTIIVANNIIEVLKRNIVDDDVFKELSETFLEIYNQKIIDSREDTRVSFEGAITYGDLFLFESSFSDMNTLKLDTIGLSSTELNILLSRLAGRLELVSDYQPIEVLKELAPLIFKYEDSQIDLNEKEKILAKKVNERI